jgi:hypothetical protein
MEGALSHRLSFTEEEIQRLFGHEAAEDEDPERLREYYFKSITYDQVVTNLPLRILVGHKGIGKSALFQIAMAEDRENGRLALVVRPDDVLDIGTDTSDFLKTIRTWKQGLIEILMRKALETIGLRLQVTEGREGLLGGQLSALLRRQITDTQLGGLEPGKREIIDGFLATGQISVYIDDLDRGWQGRKEDVRRISALLNAVRDIGNENRGVRFRISLRSDVYFLVRTSDESTDKIEGSVVWQAWSNHEIFVLLVKRIETFFGREQDYHSLLEMRQSALSQYLQPIMEARFQGRGHWSDAPMYRVLMSLIRRRPRDLVKLCSLAARNASLKRSPRILTSNLEAIFEDYSQGRIQDNINEFRSELPDISRLLLNMKPTRNEIRNRQGFIYTTASLLTKIGTIQEQGRFEFQGGRLASAKDLAAFMYKINFLTARKERADTIIRKYFEESRYLQNQFAEFGFDWEIHPAYRWALQPSDIDRIFLSLKLTADDEWE